MNKSQALPKLDKTQARPGTSILHRQPASPNLMLDGPSESPPLATCCCCWESLLFELDKLLSQQSFDFAGNRGCLHQTSVANALIVIELSWQPSNVSCFAAWARTTPTTSEYYSGGGRTVVTGLQDTDPRKSNIYIYIHFFSSLSLSVHVGVHYTLYYFHLFLTHRTDNNYPQNSVFFIYILRLWSSRHALLHRPDGLVLLPAAADQGSSTRPWRPKVEVSAVDGLMGWWWLMMVAFTLW